MIVVMARVLFIFGTRPEAIKLAPLINVMRDDFDVRVCITAQHREMLDSAMNFFRIKADYDLDIMKPNQNLYDLTGDLIKSLKLVIEKDRPDIIFVQGDTTTTFMGALAGFYSKVKVAHVEAGLRSFNKFAPFPEEINRVLVSHIADFHFAPTQKAKMNLEREGIKQNVWVVGNTVIDALFLGLKIIREEGDKKYRDFFSFLDFSKKIILITGHRRESFGEPFRNICFAIREIADKYEDVEVVYPVHLNPNVRKPVFEILGKHPRIHLIEPIDYPYLIWIMNKCYFVLTDSGGIQEEAPSLGKPVLVMRDTTERWEGIEAGTAKLVGTQKDKIVREAQKLLEDKTEYEKMAKAVNPYGDGKSSERIKNIIMKEMS